MAGKEGFLEEVVPQDLTDAQVDVRDRLVRKQRPDKKGLAAHEVAFHSA